MTPIAQHLCILLLLGASIAPAEGFRFASTHDYISLPPKTRHCLRYFQRQRSPLLESRREGDSVGISGLFPEKLNIIYDSKCSVCQFEVDYLQDRMKELGDSSLIRFTDLEAKEGYDETDPANGGVTYEMGMKSFHAVKSNGEVLHGVPVFVAAYEIVDQAWVWAAAKVPIIGNLASMGYDLFAKIRTPLTRGSLVDDLIEKHYQQKSQQECIPCQRKVGGQ